MFNGVVVVSSVVAVAVAPFEFDALGSPPAASVGCAVVVAGADAGADPEVDGGEAPPGGGPVAARPSSSMMLIGFESTVCVPCTRRRL